MNSHPFKKVVLDVDDSDDVALYNRATYEFPPFEDACQSIGVHPKVSLGVSHVQAIVVSSNINCATSSGKCYCL